MIYFDKDTWRSWMQVTIYQAGDFFGATKRHVNEFMVNLDGFGLYRLVWIEPQMDWISIHPKQLDIDHTINNMLCHGVLGARTGPLFLLKSFLQT
jgi:hypothetical protein